MNTDRIERIKKTVMVDHYPICIEKFRITLDVREQTRNDSVLIQRGKILKACAEADINIRMIDQGSSEINIIVGIDEADYEKAVNALYSAFFK